MAETTETTKTEPTTFTGRCCLSMVNSLDTYGYLTTVEWDHDQVTTVRASSGRCTTEITTERDTVTENALLGLIVPGVRPPVDFSMMILADDCSGTWPGFMHLRVRGGKAEIVPHGGTAYPAPYPAWFLDALRDVVLVDGEES